MQARKPKETERPTRIRRRQPSPQTATCASAANTNPAGTAGYSVIVAQPAERPRRSPQRKSQPLLSDALSLTAKPNPKSRKAAAVACPQKSVAYGQSGVASPMVNAAMADAVRSDPSLSAMRNKH